MSTLIQGFETLQDLVFLCNVYFFYHKLHKFSQILIINYIIKTILERI
jgi:hypothetical protein